MCCQFILGIENKIQKILGIMDLGRSLMRPFKQSSTRSPNLPWHLLTIQNRTFQHWLVTRSLSKMWVNCIQISDFWFGIQTVVSTADWKVWNSNQPWWLGLLARQLSHSVDHGVWANGGSNPRSGHTRDNNNENKWNLR